MYKCLIFKFKWRIRFIFKISKGKVNYIFSDKTGTLTKNYMNFTNIIVNDVAYGDRYGISKP